MLRLTPRDLALIEELDVDVLCEGLNQSPEAARTILREGIVAGLLRIEATATEVHLIATFPDEEAS